MMLFEQLQRLPKVLCLESYLLDMGAADAAQSQGRFRNDPGQSHATAGSQNQLRGFAVRAVSDLAVVAGQGQGVDECAEAAVQVVVLAVSVAGDGAGDTDQSREPASGQEHVDDLCQWGTGIATQAAALFIEGSQAIRLARTQQGSAGGGIAIATAHSPS
ncbi:hypothetical protein A6723_002000 [Pseudomonas sp. AU11447]|nr:hypothetical protein A6723_002000 [Pseudomonas sp. AU11447]